MHGVAFGYAPTYLLDAVVPVSMLPGRMHLRSADSGLYDVPQVSSSVGSRAISVAGPQAWSQLPTLICQMDCVAMFKRHLKTSLFMEAYCGLINSLLLVKLLFPLMFQLLYCILGHSILFIAAVHYCKRRYTNSYCDYDYDYYYFVYQPFFQFNLGQLVPLRCSAYTHSGRELISVLRPYISPVRLPRERKELVGVCDVC